jgi:pyruvate,water dikinase
VLKALAASEEGRAFLKDIDAYKMEYGNKAIYTHEYIFTTWRENPAPIIEALRGQLLDDYDYDAAVKKLRDGRDAAIAEMWSRVPSDCTAEQRDKLQNALDLALKMVPLTPDHHFYMDQGTYSRVRLVFMAIGRKLVERGDFPQPDDIFYLKYEELRILSANPAAFDTSTMTEWSLHGEPYKTLWGWPDLYANEKETARQPMDTVRGLGASAGVIEGIARIVQSPDEFNQVKKGEIVVCKMTNPAWVVIFTRIGGLITDAGGALSHPAVVSREYGIPAVVGTSVATQRIKTGQRVRLNGAAGVVEILG